MSEDFSDDFVIEDEESEGSGRSFLITAGALIGVFILLAGCVLTYVLLNSRSESESSAATREAIEIQNATIEAQNAIVEQTRAAVEDAALIAEAEADATAEAEATRAAEIASLPPTRTPVPELSAADIAATAEAEATPGKSPAIEPTATVFQPTRTPRPTATPLIPSAPTTTR